MQLRHADEIKSVTIRWESQPLVPIAMPGSCSIANRFTYLQLPCELRSLRGSFRELRSMSGYGTKRTNSMGR